MKYIELCTGNSICQKEKKKCYIFRSSVEPINETSKHLFLSVSKAKKGWKSENLQEAASCVTLKTLFPLCFIYLFSAYFQKRVLISELVTILFN